MAEGDGSKVHPPYGRGSAPHWAYRQGSDNGEQGLAPDTGAVLDHAPRN